MSDIKLPPHAISTDHPTHPAEGWSVAELAWIAERDKAFLAYARAAVQANVPDGWRPIETAPKDGTAIWAFNTHDHTGSPWQYECSWNGACWYHGFGDGWSDRPPSHWRPMPAAPGAAAPQVAQRCPNCDDTGDVHTIDGQWRGTCHCPAGQAINSRQAQPAERKPLDTDLVDYVLQDDIHNRLTPRVVDIAYSAFVIGRTGTNKDDGGPCDWFNDTKPMVTEQLAKIRKELKLPPTE